MGSLLCSSCIGLCEKYGTRVSVSNTKQVLKGSDDVAFGGSGMDADHPATGIGQIWSFGPVARESSDRRPGSNRVPSSIEDSRWLASA